MAKYLVLIYGDEREWASMSYDLDEVMGLASRLYEASAGHGGVEIRPVVERG